MRVVTLLSGGMDSAVTLAQAITDNQHTEHMAVSFRYPSIHNERELVAAAAVAQFYTVDHVIINIPRGLFSGSGSALLGESEIPKEEYHDPEKESPSATVVPFRNAVFLALAIAKAAAWKADYTYIGVHATDWLGWAYPDCSPEFIGTFQAATYIGTGRQVRLVAPFLRHTKAFIVKTGIELGVPFELTWSCYRGGKKPCGECPTCLERAKAFAEVGMRDPLCSK